MGRSHDPKIICSNQAYDKYTNDTIQTDRDMLELSYRKLETLIEGTLGDTVKIEDLSLKPLTLLNALGGCSPAFSGVAVVQPGLLPSTKPPPHKFPLLLTCRRERRVYLRKTLTPGLLVLKHSTVRRTRPKVMRLQGF
jgi:hypothetical protein